MKCKYHSHSKQQLIEELKRIAKEMFSIRMQNAMQSDNKLKNSYRDLKKSKAQILTMMTKNFSSSNLNLNENL